MTPSFFSSSTPGPKDTVWVLYMKWLGGLVDGGGGGSGSSNGFISEEGDPLVTEDGEPLIPEE